MIKRILGVGMASLAATVGLSALVAPRAHADFPLDPDLSAYCATRSPVAMQEAALDWKSWFKGTKGTPGRNDWSCTYYVATSWPVGKDSAGPISVIWSTPVDWDDLCNKQFPGARAQYVFGKLTGQPWTCKGPEGRKYDLAEQADGTHKVLSG